MITNHPDTENLAAYLYSPNDGRYASVQLHLEECVFCQQELNKIRKVLEHLKNAELATPVNGRAGHLTENDLIIYVSKAANNSNLFRIQSHLDDCRDCMKQLMLYRTRHHQWVSTKVESAILEDAVEKPNEIWQTATLLNRVRDIFSKPGLFPARASFAVIAIILMSVIIVNQFLDSDVFENSDNLLSPDVIAIDSRGNYASQIAETVGKSLDKVSQDVALQNVNLHDTASQTVNGVNWYHGYVETTAIGTVDMATMKNRVQAEIVAEKTARHLAYAQLVEILNGIKITAATTYKVLLMKTDSLELASEGFIRGAKVKGKKIEWLGGVPKVSVTLRLPLFGRDGLRGIVLENMPQELFSAERNVVVFSPKMRTARIEKYTGVIIDASDIDYEPALLFSVLSQQNELVVSDTSANESKIVPAYYSQLNDALNSNYAGKVPYIIKAKAQRGAGSILIKQDDASVISDMLKDRNGIPEKLMVVF